VRRLKRTLAWVAGVSCLLASVCLFLTFGGPPRVAFLAWFVGVFFLVIAFPLLITIAALDAWGLVKWLLVHILLTSIVAVLLFLSILSGLPDIPYAMNKEYATVEGQAAVENGTPHHAFYQQITIGETTYKNDSVFWQKAKDGRTYTLKYLPNSKIIMEIIGPLDEPEPTPEPTATPGPSPTPKKKRR